ncbi:MAG: type II toxin-antitoxin system VapC family toxin [Lachnospiraceae bacterium]|nr:type II toxin-antitoxin system VapC family toxin [Lachnospiraceae bacterium]
MYLLDTNALLYFLYDSEKLSKKASDIIYHNNAKISVSIVSMWEIAIKSSIGKLEIKSSISKIAETCEKEQFEILSIKPFHLDEIGRLPAIHGDPFDRLIISQAISENLVLITKDGTIPLYNVKVLW